MSVNEKIRKIREAKKWSQEQMAEKLNMSLNGYAKIERGESKIYLYKLEQIAHVFGIDIVELMQFDGKNICFQINENSYLSTNYYGDNEALMIENERLKLSLSYNQQLLEQKDNEIQLLKEMVSLLKQDKQS
ncbi:helix-turn-helix domain-containing protein [Rodentibacter pneumotropicus]|uniref:XRE family transcriptional regulator n=1 Tax=Rodentibacter pneumotropicus TaxID=758 RepID=A0A4S2PKN0_9PAST|nr:helix-turn-helix transcriptional regulator [Rodentibacter pneumotropicus]MDC2825599.1 helix-turn-helix transcriptional regulator [Rodentibacter pneumotropicus]NBH75376.1 XRE family transcriptional regulator [Rodentibacter pneumotropicus]OOF64232.1 transcriptional regulator [Rodentibacter pneumotropicus]OOF65342.1 transcriptional regulator [Rodentibacter pneumotropicus]THA03969.1 XRE family transcriptional regulator [Rodentibacter pneumotropicus]